MSKISINCNYKLIKFGKFPISLGIVLIPLLHKNLYINILFLFLF